jgi:hypothetical protein
MEPGRLRGKSSDRKIHPAIPASHFGLRRGNKRLCFRLPEVFGVNQGFIGRPTTPEVGAIAIVPSPHRKHPPEQIARKLREADKLLCDGADVASVESSTVPKQTRTRIRPDPQAGRGDSGGEAGHTSIAIRAGAPQCVTISPPRAEISAAQKGNNAKRTPIVIGSFRPHGVPTDRPRWPAHCGDPPP